MSAAEIGWRMRGAVRNGMDRLAHRSRLQLPAVKRIAKVECAERAWGSARLGPFDSGPLELPTTLHGAREALLRRTNRIMVDRLVPIFGRYECDLRSASPWNFDFSAGRATPCGPSWGIDYRDHSKAGDAKVVWEPNRHQHLVVLARAYRVTGDVAYSQEVVRQILGWIRDCPFGTGMNWRSPLELAIRLINWAWALDLIAPSGLPERDDAGVIAGAAYRHLWETARKYSRYSSANNHLIGEAAGVFIGSTFFAGLRRAAKWREESYQILCHEIHSQTNADGANAELAMGYHLFVLEFFLLAGLAGRRNGMDFPGDYWNRLESTFEYLAAFQEGGENLPMFGDCDDGYVLDLGSGPKGREWLAAGAVLFSRPDFAQLGESHGETAFWLFGEGAAGRLKTLCEERPARGVTLTSKAFPQSGYYLLQCGALERDDRISVTFDCGELGFGAIAAHGHADALSFTLRACGRDVFVDPGTYDYFTFPDWRNHFRSTRAHNTVMVDGRDQSEMLGPFLWGRRAVTKCLSWKKDETRTEVCGEHDGYTVLPGGVVHRRTISLEHGAGEVTICDDLRGEGEHNAEICFHLSPDCEAECFGADECRIECGRGTVVLRLDPKLSVRLWRGCTESKLGWVSDGYHRKRPATTLVASGRWRDAFQTVCRISVQCQDQ